MTDLERLQQLVVNRHPCVIVTTYEEPYVLGLLRHAAVEAGRDLWMWTVTRGLHDGLVAGSAAVADTEHPAAALYHLAAGGTGAMDAMVDVVGHLKDERTLRACREAIDKLADAGGQLVLIDHQEDLPAAISSAATRFAVSLPNEAELEDLVKQTLRAANRDRPIDVHLSRGDLRTVVRNLRGLTRRQARRVILDATCDDRRFDASDVNHIIAAKRQALGGEGVLEYVEAPVDLAEIGGLGRLKTWLARRRDCFADDAVAFGLRPPRGVLMLGVQGAGKSLSAKAVATAWQRPLLRLDAGALYDRYVGESERRLRDALRQAEMMAPVVLWIDEIEKGFASAASQSTDGGLSKRMFGTLLTWMQEHRAPVFLIATANDIEALPPELLRKGRFDEIFFVDLPSLESRHAILAIHLRKRKRDPKKFDLARLAEAGAGFSGAELEQAIVAALHDAYAAKVELTTDHILTALRDSPPLSVTMAEKVAALRAWAAARCVPAE